MLLKKFLGVCVILGLLFTTQACSPQNNKLFSYDSSRPFNTKEISVRDTERGIKIHEISYDAYDSILSQDGKISAYLVVPEGKGPFPAVIYLHWLGKENANKGQFLDEAQTLAKKGVVSLLLDGYFPWKTSPSALEKDKTMVKAQVIELRRAIDYITGLSYVNPQKLGYVGHDYGALYGSVLSGVDKRIKSYTLVAGMGDFSDWFLKYWVSLDSDGKQKYRQGMSELDPINYIENASPAKLFFQFSNRDRFISKGTADKFYEAASKPKEEKFYDTSHEMDNDQAKADRLQWLYKCLGVE